MMSLSVSVIFIFFGFLLWAFPPKRINGMYGYRTPMSMKNQDTWDTAQKLGGISMMIFGIINTIFGIWAIIIPLSVNGQSGQMLLMLIGSLAMIIIDEIQLRRIFNRDGIRK